ncbi:free fatty acid receptor 4-like [Lethenteron reissneri]|uniref:free fatty acid receptor 4-like n=1 Tax=Lethenteron reissneri TaxID=7753 RepID=UPI002AB74BF8|nr:free fatty acid receptor 4-like [Lethenteron reissneri]
MGSVSYLEGFAEPYGNQSFFTFFSTFGVYNQRAEASAETTILVLIFITSLVGNVTVLLIVFTTSYMRSTTCLLVTNLAVLDIVFTLNIPAIVITRWTGSWILGKGLCKITLFNMSLCGFCSVLTMALISFDRARHILPPHVRAIRTRGQLFVSICVAWVLSCVGALPLSIYFQVKTFTFSGEEVHICTILWPTRGTSWSWLVVIFLSMLVVPSTVLTLNYKRIYKVARDSRIRVRQNAEPARLNGGIRISFKEFRLIKMLIILVISLYIMWVPIYIMLWLIEADRELVNVYNWKPFLSSRAFLWVCTVTLTNSAINPVLYGVLNTQFRRGFKRYFCCLLRANADSATDETTTNDQNVQNVEQLHGREAAGRRQRRGEGRGPRARLWGARGGVAGGHHNREVKWRPPR